MDQEKTVIGQKITKETTKILKEKVQTSVEAITQKAASLMKLYSGHLFRAAWQAKQFQIIKENIPPSTAVVVIDFAENYTCSLNDEI